MTRKPALGRPILAFANIVQTIPSLALFGFLIPVPFIGGIGSQTAILALFLYSLLPIIRNTFAGISGVDPAIREAGRGMGMTDRQLLRQVRDTSGDGCDLCRDSCGNSHCRWRRDHRGRCGSLEDWVYSFFVVLP